MLHSLRNKVYIYRLCLCSKEMEKSYAKLAGQTRKAGSVAEAISNLQRHSCRSVICSLCENDDRSCFQVTDIDIATGSITEVQCKKKHCKTRSFVCRGECYCKTNATEDGLESSYKEQLRNCTVLHNRKSIHICNVMNSTVALLRRDNNGNTVCSCGNNDTDQLKVTDVDRLGFVTSIHCLACQKPLALSPLEVSFVVQILHDGQSESDQAAVIQKVLDGDYDARLLELCNLLQRHSFYGDSICPEANSNDRECCRVINTDKESGKVTEVEFDVKTGRLHQVQRLQITCYSRCYYDHCNSPSEYEQTYKEEMRKQLLHVAVEETARTDQTSEVHTKEAILSCTVLAASAAILRRHNIDNKLCQKCKNDDHNFLKVKETDRFGFITRVQCTKCSSPTSMSTECHNSRFYYEEIDESVPLTRGDHISWHRNSSYWHHAIVTHSDNQKTTIAHYGSSGCSVTFHNSVKSRQDIATSLLSGTAYRITYDDCYTNEYTALRAERVVGERRYNILNRNCEHRSHWCKTGLTRSDQMATCFSSVGKTVLAFSLRILNMLLLMVFQLIHEGREGIQIDRKAFERFEHIITSAYMSVVFLLFSVWSMYSECNKIKPTTNKCCCARPTRVALGLSIRIITRELFATLGPFLLIWFEDSLLPQDALWKKQVTISFTLLGVTIASYVLGAVIGTLLEYISKRLYLLCCNNNHSDDDLASQEDT